MDYLLILIPMLHSCRLIVAKYYALCVDDDQAILNQLAIQLEEYFRSFCEFEYAETAEEALQIYDEWIDYGNRVWLVLSDQILPGMSGDNLLAKIHEQDQHIIKVLLTGQAGLESTIRAINHAGLNYYIEKPWRQEDLLMILDKLKFQFEMSSILNEMNLRFASSIDMDETLNTVFYNILNTIQAEAGSIFLVDQGNQHLVCKMSMGPKKILGMRVPMGSGIVGHVAQTRQIDVTENVKQDKRHYSKIDEQSGFVTRSMVSVPLIAKNEVIGVIQVINKEGGKRFSLNDITLLQSLSNGAAIAIQNAQYAQRLIQEERIRSELLIAHQIQQGILPAPFKGHPNIHFAAINHSAKDVGGDFYDYFQVNEHEFAFVIGDVCGKGIPAAIFMASSRSIIKAHALSNPHPASVIPLANQIIAEDAQPGMFVTVFYGVYNISSQKLRFINAGHTLPLLYRPSTMSCSSLLNANLPIGLFVPPSFEDAEIQLQPGDRLVLYTDGINEAENAEREQFGVERLIRDILTHSDLAPEEFLDYVLNQVTTFAEGQEQKDDITMMVVQV